MNFSNLSMKTLRLPLVEEGDAEFILSLRLNTGLNAFLSKVSSDLQEQIDWIRQYKEDEKRSRQFYFILERMDGVKCGTVRVYDLRDDSFSWGSWMLNEDKTRYAAIESALLVYTFGFERLGYKQSHFEVMKENVGVVRFHERMGAEKIGEDSDFFYFKISEEAVNSQRLKLQELLS